MQQTVGEDSSGWDKANRDGLALSPAAFPLERDAMAFARLAPQRRFFIRLTP